MDDKNNNNLPDYRKIKIGWARLDENTKAKLKSMGIHDLHHTPGKLITAKGHIDGYLSAYGIVWGKISATGEKAQKMMGFTPKEGAIGVLLARRRYVDNNGKVKSGIFATSLMHHYIFPTDKETSVWERVAVLGKMGSKSMKNMIHPIWEPLVINKNRKPWSGFHYFMSLNVSALGHLIDWSKLLISKGKLPHPYKGMLNLLSYCGK